MKELPLVNDWAKQLREKLGAGNKKSIGEIFNSDSILGKARTTEAPTTTTTTARYDFVKPQAYTTDTRKYLPLHEDDTDSSPIPGDSSSPKHIILRPSPSAFKTTNYADLVGEVNSAAHGDNGEEEVAIIANNQPDCDCDSAQLEELLRQLALEYQRYREKVDQHFDAYNAQVSGGERSPAMSSDTNLCDNLGNCGVQQVDGAANVDHIPSPNVPPVIPAAFRDQFMSYFDFANMVQSPNGNQNTINSVHDDEVVASSAQNIQNVATMQNSRNTLFNNLKDIAQLHGSENVGEQNLQALHLQNNLKHAANTLMAQKVLALNNIMTKLKAATLKNKLTF